MQEQRQVWRTSWKKMQGSNLDFERRTLYYCSKTSFARFRARWMREREIHQKHIENDSKTHPKIDTKSMPNSCSTKECKKHGKSIKTRPKGNDKPLKINVKRIRKIGSKQKWSRGGPGDPKEGWSGCQEGGRGEVNLPPGIGGSENIRNLKSEEEKKGRRIYTLDRKGRRIQGARVDAWSDPGRMRWRLRSIVDDYADL